MYNRVKNTITRLQQRGFLNNLELLEVLKVLCLYKTSCRIARFNRLQANGINRLLQEVQLPFVVVEVKGYGNCYDRGKGGWSNIVSQGKKANVSFFYIGITRKDAISASKTGEGNLNWQSDGVTQDAGREFSYPECCRLFFEKNWDKAQKIQGDMFPWTYSFTSSPLSGLPYILNPLWYFNVGYIEYWPCSFHCENAMQDAAIGRMLMRKYLPDIAKEMERLLRNPVLYTEYSGIHVFLDAKYDNERQEVFYKPGQVESSAQTSLAKKLQSGNTLKHEKGKWLVYQDDRLLGPVKCKDAILAPFTLKTVPKLSKTALRIKQIQALNMYFPFTTLIESVMLMSGHKRCLRLIVESDELEKAKMLGRILQKKYFISPLRVSIVNNLSTGDQYVDYVRDAGESAPYLICYSSTFEDAKRCSELEVSSLKSDQNELMDYLNYPMCCMANFAQRVPQNDWLKAFLSHTPISGKYPCWTNRMAYLFSGRYLLYDYEPCSAFCSESIALGKSIRDELLRHGLASLYHEILSDALTPIFLHGGVLVKMNGATVTETPQGKEINYSPSEFQIKDYKLDKAVENSCFWDSNRMIVNGNAISLFAGEREIGRLKQSKYKDRIFIFEE